MTAKIFFAGIFLSAVSLAQISAEYEYTFTFTDQFNNSQDLILGKDPFGSDGIDTLFGEAYIPQVPPGEFGVRFQIPPDTSITTTKDIRFVCYWATGHEHLLDINYQTGSSYISVLWDWDTLGIFGLGTITFVNPYNGQILAQYSWSPDSSTFSIPASLDKIKIWTSYGGTLSWEEYEVLSPNGGEVIEAGETYTITWWDNDLAIYMDIELSTDSGTTWSYIVEDLFIYQINSYEWQVPFFNSENCLIRLGDYPCRYDISDTIFTIERPTTISETEEAPSEFSLAQNYPNPFNPTTKIKFTIPSNVILSEAKNLITLKVYDVLGNEIATLINEEKPAGEYEVEFNVAQTNNLSSGIYFYRLLTGNFTETKKMVLMK